MSLSDGARCNWFEDNNRSWNSLPRLLRALREWNARRLDTGNFQFASDHIIKRVISLMSVRLRIYFENGTSQLSRSLPLSFSLFRQNEINLCLPHFNVCVISKDALIKLRSLNTINILSNILSKVCRMLHALDN